MQTVLFLTVFLICGCNQKTDTRPNLNHVDSIINDDKNKVNIDKVGLGNLFFAKHSGMLLCSEGATGFAIIDGINYTIELGREKSVTDENPDGASYAILLITGKNLILVYKYYYRDDNVGESAINEFLK